MVVVDEAYIDFADASKDSACTLIHQHPKLIVMQTLSKAFGLAGIRLGMAFSSTETIQYFNNMKAPYNISKLTSRAAIEAFENLDTMRGNVSTLVSEREKLATALTAMNFVEKVHSSSTNFLLVKVRHSVACVACCCQAIGCGVSDCVMWRSAV